MQSLKTSTTQSRNALRVMIAANCTGLTATGKDGARGAAAITTGTDSTARKFAAGAGLKSNPDEMSKKNKTPC